MEEEYYGVSYQWVMVGLGLHDDCGVSEQQRDELLDRLAGLWNQYNEP